MNKLKTLIAVVAIAISCQAHANGGEAGNERLTPDGRPLSTDVPQCAAHLEGEDFLAQMMKRPQFADFMAAIRKIYPPLYLESMSILAGVAVCETDKPINDVWTDPTVHQKRLGLVIPNGEGRRDLLLIDPKEFFHNPKIGDDRRAATIFRESLHEIFSRSFGPNDAKKVEWMKRNLIFELHNDFVNGALAANRAKFVHMFYDYELISNYSFQISYGTADACRHSLEDCKNTFSALDMVIPATDILDVEAYTIRASLDIDSFAFILSRLTPQSIAESSTINYSITTAFDTQIKNVKTVNDLERLYQAVMQAGLGAQYLQQLTDKTVDCAAKMYAVGTCQNSVDTATGQGDPATAHAIMEYLRSIHAPIGSVNIVLSGLPTATAISYLRFQKTENVSLKMGNAWFACWLIGNPPTDNIDSFQKIVDEFPELFTLETAKNMFIYRRIGETDAEKFAYLIQKGLLKQNLHYVGPSLREVLRQYPETKRFAQELAGR